MSKTLTWFVLLFVYFGSIGISIYYIHRHHEQNKKLEHQQLVIEHMEKELKEAYNEITKLREYTRYVITNGNQTLTKDKYHKQQKLEIMKEAYYEGLQTREKKAKDFERLIKAYDEQNRKLWYEISKLDPFFMKVKK